MTRRAIMATSARTKTGSPREVAARFYESFDRGDIPGALLSFSTELETTDPGMGTVHGLEPFREYLETLKRAVPDARAVIEQLREAGDAVIVEGRFVGTFDGPLATPDGDAAPTGAHVACASPMCRASGTGR